MPAAGLTGLSISALVIRQKHLEKKAVVTNRKNESPTANDTCQIFMPES